MKKLLIVMLALTLMLTGLVACTPKTPETPDVTPNVPNEPVKEKEELTEEDIKEIIGEIAATAADLKTEDEEKTVFDFIVTHSDGKKVAYAVETTKDNLGDALLENEIIEGDEGQFGIYVTVINGEEASWDKDKAYWYFYKDGEALLESISATPIANGDKFEAIYTK